MQPYMYVHISTLARGVSGGYTIDFHVLKTRMCMYKNKYIYIYKYLFMNVYIHVQPIYTLECVSSEKLSQTKGWFEIP